MIERQTRAIAAEHGVTAQSVSVLKLGYSWRNIDCVRVTRGRRWPKGGGPNV